MKKIIMKSFLGVPVAIFLYEIINIIFSILAFEGQYFRLDGVNGINLNEVIISYIELAILGYSMIFLMLYSSYITFTEKNQVNRARKDAKIYVIMFGLFMLFTLLISKLNDESNMIPLAFVIILVVFGVANMIKSIVDENTIKKINQKIKENQDKED